MGHKKKGKERSGMKKYSIRFNKRTGLIQVYLGSMPRGINLMYRDVEAVFESDEWSLALAWVIRKQTKQARKQIKKNK